MENTDNISKRLIEKLLAIPFPYCDILDQQIKNSTIRNSIYPDLYEVFFNVDSAAPRFPPYLDNMPISWQIIVDNQASYCCQLFLNEFGYIRVLEIIDMWFAEIKWDYVWDQPMHLDIDYDVQHLQDILECEQVYINNIKVCGNSVDMFLVEPSGTRKICFRNCNIREYHPLTLPANMQFSCRRNLETISVATNDKVIDFDCSLAYILNS